MSDKHLVADVISTGQPGKGQVYHFSNLTDAEREQRYGRGDYSIDSDIIAGSTVTIRFRFTVGKKEMSQNSRLRVAWRWPFDWADLQKTNPESSNHLTVKAPENVHLAVQYEQKGNLNPWLHNIDLRVTQGHLQQGDIVDLTCARWQAPTFATLDGYFLFLVNIDEDNCWFRLSDPPRFNIIPGPPDHLIAIAPSDGVIGESSIVRVRAVDAWENPTSIPKPQLLCQKAEIDEPGACDKYPVWEFPVRWKAPGIQRLRATCQNLEAETNPVQVYLETPNNASTGAICIVVSLKSDAGWAPWKTTMLMHETWPPCNLPRNRQTIITLPAPCGNTCDLSHPNTMTKVNFWLSWGANGVRLQKTAGTATSSIATMNRACADQADSSPKLSPTRSQIYPMRPNFWKPSKKNRFYSIYMWEVAPPI